MPTSTPVLDSMEGAGLGQISRVIVCDQFRCIPELRGEDPRGLLIGTGIPGPADEVQQLAVMAPLIDLGVENLSDLKLRLTIYEDGRRQRLYSVGDCVRGCRFQHRDVKHQVDSAEVVR